MAVRDLGCPILRGAPGRLTREKVCQVEWFGEGTVSGKPGITRIGAVKEAEALTLAKRSTR